MELRPHPHIYPSLLVEDSFFSALIHTFGHETALLTTPASVTLRGA
jgi:hypothetical protein